MDLSSSVNLLPKNKASLVQGAIIPSGKVSYLREIAETVRKYNEQTDSTAQKINQLEQLQSISRNFSLDLGDKIKKIETEIEPEALSAVAWFKDIAQKYAAPQYSFEVRKKTVTVDTKYESLSGQKISRVAIPKLTHHDDIYKFVREENLPGYFPFAAGIFLFF